MKKLVVGTAVLFAATAIGVATFAGGAEKCNPNLENRQEYEQCLLAPGGGLCGHILDWKCFCDQANRDNFTILDGVMCSHIDAGGTETSELEECYRKSPNQITEEEVAEVDEQFWPAWKYHECSCQHSLIIQQSDEVLECAFRARYRVESELDRVYKIDHALQHEEELAFPSARGTAKAHADWQLAWKRYRAASCEFHNLYIAGAGQNWKYVHEQNCLREMAEARIEELKNKEPPGQTL